MPTILDKQIGPYGFGLMGITWRAKQTPDDQAFAAMKAALANGSNFWNGGEFYGSPESNSLQLLNRYFTKYPEDADKVVVSIKGGLVNMHPKGDEVSVRASVDNCNKLLGGKKKLDIFECARVDPNIPIEDTVRTLGKLVEEGKLRGISLSEVNADTIKRAAKVHAITAVEIELSLWEDNVLKNGVLETCGELGIPVIAYSPLGRGFLTGQLKSFDDLDPSDMRRHYPRFSKENFPKNLELVNQLEGIARAKGVTAAQLALAWVRQLGDKPRMPTIIPIPGATSKERVNENMDVKTLTENELKSVDKVLATFTASGTRYPEQLMGLCDQ